MDELATLLALLPPDIAARLMLYTPFAMGVLSLLLAAFKRWALPRIAEGKVKAVLVLFLAKLDWLAANSRKVTDSQEFADLKRKLGERERDLLQRDEALRRKTDRIVELTAMVIDQRGRPTLELVDADLLPLAAPDNDNGTPGSNTGDAS